MPDLTMQDRSTVHSAIVADITQNSARLSWTIHERKLTRQACIDLGGRPVDGFCSLGVPDEHGHMRDSEKLIDADMPDGYWIVVGLDSPFGPIEGEQKWRTPDNPWMYAVLPPGTESVELTSLWNRVIRYRVFLMGPVRYPKWPDPQGDGSMKWHTYDLTRPGLGYEQGDIVSGEFTTVSPFPKAPPVVAPSDVQGGPTTFREHITSVLQRGLVPGATRDDAFLARYLAECLGTYDELRAKMRDVGKRMAGESDG